MGGVLRAISATDGNQLAQYTLESAPVFDGLSAAKGRLLLSTRDGNITCMGQKWVVVQEGCPNVCGIIIPPSRVVPVAFAPVTFGSSSPTAGRVDRIVHCGCSFFMGEKTLHGLPCFAAGDGEPHGVAYTFGRQLSCAATCPFFARPHGTRRFGGVAAGPTAPGLQESVKDSSDFIIDADSE